MVEAGLGGVRDATNVFGPQQLLLAIITALGLEHQAALGQHLFCTVSLLDLDLCGPKH